MSQRGQNGHLPLTGHQANGNYPQGDDNFEMKSNEIEDRAGSSPLGRRVGRFVEIRPSTDSPPAPNPTETEEPVDDSQAQPTPLREPATDESQPEPAEAIEFSTEISSHPQPSNTHTTMAQTNDMPSLTDEETPPAAHHPQPAPPVSNVQEQVRDAASKLTLLQDHRDTFEWILEKQNGLREEFVGFLKKDLREIEYVVTDMKVSGDKQEFVGNTLDLIKNTYIKHWEKSFDLISPADLLHRPGEKE